MLNTEQKQYVGNSVVGLAGGTAAFVWCPTLISKPYGKYFLRQTRKVTPQEQDTFWNAAQQAYNQSDLKGKNIKIVDLNKSNCKPITDEIIQKRREYLKKINPIKRFFLNNMYTEEQLRASMRQISKGRNACFMGGSLKIFANKEKMAETVFHEMGHAINFTDNGFKKVLAKSRAISMAAPFVFLAGILTPKKNEERPVNNPIYKFLLSVKKYAGFIVAACILPKVAEEGLASINGAKLAKNVLSSEMYKKLNKLNGAAFGTYALSMVLAGIGTAMAIYIKDKVTGPLPLKNKSENDGTRLNAESTPTD